MVADVLREYLAKPYSRVLVPDETGGYVAQVLELPGCIAEGETAAEAIHNLDDAMEAWIEAVIEDGGAVPEPLDLQGYSGRLVVRMPKWVHKETTRRAQMEGVSLNQWIVDAVGERLGADRCVERLREAISGVWGHPAFGGGAVLALRMRVSDLQIYQGYKELPGSVNLGGTAWCVGATEGKEVSYA